VSPVSPVIISSSISPISSLLSSSNHPEDVTNLALTHTLCPDNEKYPIEGFNLVGSGEKTDDCLKWKPYATAKKGETDQYSDTSSNHIVLGPHFCKRRECPTCLKHGWVSSTGSRSTRELISDFRKMCDMGLFRKPYEITDKNGKKRKIQRRLKWYAGVISPAIHKYPTSEEELKSLRTEVNNIAKKQGFICFRNILHPYRGSKPDELEFTGEDPDDPLSEDPKNPRALDTDKLSLHFHIVGFGYFIEPGGSDEDFIYKTTSGRRLPDGSFKPGSLGTVDGFYWGDGLDKSYMDGDDPPFNVDVQHKAKRKQFDLKGLALRLSGLWNKINHRIRYCLDHAGYFIDEDYTSQVITGCGPRKYNDRSCDRPDPYRYYEVHRQYSDEGENGYPYEIMEIIGDTFPQVSNFKYDFMNDPHVKDLFEKDSLQEELSYTGRVDGHCIKEGDPDHDPLTCKLCIRTKLKLLQEIGAYEPEDHSRFFYKHKDPPPNGIRLGIDEDPVWLWVHGEGGGLGFCKDDTEGMLWDMELICLCYPRYKRDIDRYIHLGS